MFIVSFGGDFWLEVEKNELPLGAGNITHEITPKLKSVAGYRAILGLQKVKQKSF